MSSVLSKEDIDRLTRNVLNSKRQILSILRDEFIEIDLNLIPKNFDEFIRNDENVNIKIENQRLITLDECEDIFHHLEIIEKQLSNGPKSNETKGMRRMNSVNDLDRTMSMTNLNSTRAFGQQAFAMPPPPPPQQSMDESLRMNEQLAIEFNLLKKQIDKMSQNIEDGDDNGKIELNLTHQKFMNSFQKYQEICKMVLSNGDIFLNQEFDTNILAKLDETFCSQLKQLAEVRIMMPLSIFMYFLSRNYLPFQMVSFECDLRQFKEQLKIRDSLKSLEFPMSNEISDLLERFNY